MNITSDNISNLMSELQRLTTVASTHCVPSMPAPLSTKCKNTAVINQTLQSTKNQQTDDLQYQ